MRILVYEHLCACFDPSAVSPSLYREGRAMLARLVADLTRLGVDVVTILHSAQPDLDLRSVRSDQFHSEIEPGGMLSALGRECDAAILIAPETGGVLARLCRLIEATCRPLLGPGSEAVELYADKLATARALGPIAVPTFAIQDIDCLDHELSVVVKPRDGCGSENTFVAQPKDAAAIADMLRDQGFEVDWIVQPYWSGTPASIALVIASDGTAAFLPAVEQCMTQVPDSIVGSAYRLSYTGGRLPLSKDLNRRAQRLAEHLRAGPRLRGYLGLDLIFGPAPDGSQDRIVEVNPRLTTSYIGYSALTDGRIAELLLSDSHPAVEASLLFRADACRFYPDGRIALSDQDRGTKEDVKRNSIQVGCPDEPAAPRSPSSM